MAQIYTFYFSFNNKIEILLPLLKVKSAFFLLNISLFPSVSLFLRIGKHLKWTNIMLEELLAYNKKFVESKGYESYITNKYPDKKIAILSCMDTRLTALLPAALGIKNGDVKMIKNAGGVISTSPDGHMSSKAPCSTPQSTPSRFRNACGSPDPARSRRPP